MFDSVISLEQLGIDVGEVMAALNLEAQPLTIFLSGSMIEGYGNAESDLDVFVIYPDRDPQQITDGGDATVNISLEYTPHWRLDVESWSNSDILLAAQCFNACPIDDWHACARLPSAYVQLSHRIRVGVPIQNEAEFRRLYDAFDFAQVSRVILGRCLMGYTASAEDAAGAIMSKQYGAALLMARSSLQIAMDAWLAACGDTNTKDKWRFFRLEKLGDPVLVERYWALELPRIERREDILQYAKECLRYAEEIVAKAQKAGRYP